MNRPIKIGDMVTVYYRTDGEKVEGEVLKKALSTGDFWYIKDKDGYVHAINPSCHDLIEIVKAGGE